MWDYQIMFISNCVFIIEYIECSKWVSQDYTKGLMEKKNVFQWKYIHSIQYMSTEKMDNVRVVSYDLLGVKWGL